MNSGAGDGRRTLPLILIAALVQGWALYGLHIAITHHRWPSTHLSWLLALYAVAVFVPLSVELLGFQSRKTTTWLILAAIAALYFYVGWNHGITVQEPGVMEGTAERELVPPALEAVILWLLILPFVECRLITGKWVPDYKLLFSVTWRNKMILAEAALFTGLLWALLGLWEQLFHMLGIDYFRDLFSEPVFFYTVTALAFGISLHLIGSLEHWTRIVLEQLLGVLKWLGVIAIVILVLFTIALLLKLRALVFFGQKAIGAAWLLWLVAVVVLFVNAAFRDGTDARVYPKVIRVAVRFAMPLLIVVSLTAGYALYVRAREYGLTVGRIWGFIVAGFALMYAVGYSWASVKRGAWLGGIATVNVVSAYLLIAVLVAALTPLASPYRLAANSQFEVAKRYREDKIPSGSFWDTPYRYLRFRTGRYGIAKLKELAGSSSPDISADVRSQATAALALTAPFQATTKTTVEAQLADLEVYPDGREVTAELRDEVVASVQQSSYGTSLSETGRPTAGIFVDLDGDGAPEFVLIWGKHARVYTRANGRWRFVSWMDAIGTSNTSIKGALTSGDFRAAPQPWSDLMIGSQRYRLRSTPL